MLWSITKEETVAGTDTVFPSLLPVPLILLAVTIASGFSRVTLKLFLIFYPMINSPFFHRYHCLLLCWVTFSSPGEAKYPLDWCWWCCLDVLTTIINIYLTPCLKFSKDTENKLQNHSNFVANRLTSFEAQWHYQKSWNIDVLCVFNKVCCFDFC